MYYPQKINSAAHVSFSVFGLGFIAAFGILVIPVSLSLESVVAFVQKRLKKNLHKRLEWRTNGILQLQRLAYERLGIGPWTGHDRLVPCLETSILLDRVDIPDEQNLGIFRIEPTPSQHKDGRNGSATNTRSTHIPMIDIESSPPSSRDSSYIQRQDGAGDVGE